VKIKPRLPSSEIPTASMADIAFLLIIFFMVTTVFSATKGLDFTLPKEEDESRQMEKVEAVYIRVYPGGGIEVDGRRMEVDQILPYLKPKLDRWPDKPVILHTEPEANYQDMINVYDELKGGASIGIYVKNISIPTNREIQEYIEFFGYNPFEVRE
jgi:biopolymer transport protein ExbD